MFYLELYFFLGFRYDEKGDIIAYNMFYLDMPSHVILINSFINQKFLPKSPFLFNTTLLYHFLADFFSSILVANGSDVVTSIKLPNALLLFSLVFSIFLIAKEISDEKTATLATFIFLFFSPAILNVFLFSLGFTKPYTKFGYNVTLDSLINFFNISALPIYYYSQPFIYIFAGERAMLLTFPIAIFILISLWHGSLKEYMASSLLLSFLMFSNYFMFVLTSFFFLFYSIRKKFYLPILVYFILSFPQVAFSFLSYTNTKTFGFYYDSQFWVTDKDFGVILNHIIFWLRVLGPFLILSVIGFILYTKNKKLKNEFKEFLEINLLIFIFINVYGITNLASWDSNKIIIYLTLMLSIFCAYLLLRLNKILMLIFVIALTYPSFYLFIRDFILYASYFTEKYNEIYPMLFFRDDLFIAKWIVNNTNSSSVFLISPTAITHPFMLTGRQALIQRYDFCIIFGQHSITGASPEEIRNVANEIFQNANCTLIKRFHVDYIFIGPLEKKEYKINFSKFDNFQIVFDKNLSGEEFRIYKTKCYS
ncbi:MAG: hypothetical protein ACPLXS_02430 [Candidatus Micrarchaeales archaeon]